MNVQNEEADVITAENDALAALRSNEDVELQGMSLIIAFRENPKQDTKADIENWSDENVTSLEASRMATVAIAVSPAIRSGKGINSIDSEAVAVMLTMLTTLEMP